MTALHDPRMCEWCGQYHRRGGAVNLEGSLIYGPFWIPEACQRGFALQAKVAVLEEAVLYLLENRPLRKSLISGVPNPPIPKTVLSTYPQLLGDKFSAQVQRHLDSLTPKERAILDRRYKRPDSDAPPADGFYESEDDQGA